MCSKNKIYRIYFPSQTKWIYFWAANGYWLKWNLISVMLWILPRTLTFEKSTSVRKINKIYIDAKRSGSFCWWGYGYLSLQNYVTFGSKCDVCSKSCRHSHLKYFLKAQLNCQILAQCDNKKFRNQDWTPWASSSAIKIVLYWKNLLAVFLNFPKLDTNLHVALSAFYVKSWHSCIGMRTRKKFSRFQLKKSIW